MYLECNDATLNGKTVYSFFYKNMKEICGKGDCDQRYIQNRVKSYINILSYINI